MLIQDALLNRTTFGFDTAGRRVLRIDGRSLRTTYAFDGVSRLVGRRYNDGTRNTFSFDPLGSRLMMADVTGRTTSVYDALQRTQSVTNPANQRITYGYDSTSNRTRLVTPDGGYFTYSWDSASRISRLVNPLSEVTTFGFDGIGRESFQQLANGTRASYSYDPANNLTRLANLTSTGTTLSSFAYLYDPVGNRQRVVEGNADRVTWTYDATYQLTHEVRDGAHAYSVTHVWDPVGNRLVKNDTGVITTATYNAGNEIVWSDDGTGRTTYTFDGTGNLALELSPALARTSYSWDGDNHLLRVALPTSIVNTMLYNADGLRVEKDDSSGVTKSLWDAQNVLLDANASNVTQALYTLQPSLFGNLLSQSRGGASSFFQFDALGSTSGLTNNLQSVTDSYLYKAFGERLTNSGVTANPWQFVGRQGYAFDSNTATFYLRARQYDPSRSHFLSHDPLAGIGEWGQYVYGDNNPLRFIDPSGMKVLPGGGGTLVIDKSCGSGCLWVKPEEGDPKWVCGEGGGVVTDFNPTVGGGGVPSGSFLIDGVYGLCGANQVFKVTDFCQLTIHCVAPVVYWYDLKCFGPFALYQCINGGCVSDPWGGWTNAPGLPPTPFGTPIILPPFPTRPKD